MRDATDGVYKTTYDLVRFDIISKELKISNLKIDLDTTVISKEDYLLKRSSLIKLNTPVIIVKLKSILPLLFNNQLYISYIGAKEPRFNLIKSLHSTVEKDSTKIREDDFMEVIKTYFSAFEIDSFRIEKGAFNITTHNDDEQELSVINIGEFTTILKNFRLDSLSPSILLKGIRAQSFELEVINQEVNLPNINQNIHFSKLHLSTIDSTFIIDSLTIKNITQNIGKSNSDYSIQKLEILGFNFQKALLDNQIRINEIHIIAPKVKFKQLDFSKTKASANNKKTGIFDFFKQLDVNKIKIFDGSLQLESRRKTSVDNFSLAINNYSITQRDWKNKKPISDLKLAAFEATGISQELPDSIHYANIESVKYSGDKNRLSLKRLNIKPIKGRNSYKILKSQDISFSHYSSIKSIELTTFIPEYLILNNHLQIDSVIIDKPTSSIVQYPAMLVSKREKFKKGDFKFTINHFITNNGSLKLRAYQNKTNQLTSLVGIYISTSKINERTSIEKLPGYFNILVSQGNSQVKNIGHTLDFKGLRIDHTKSLFLEQATLKPDSTTLPFHHINAKTENVKIKGVNLVKLQSASLQIDSILIGKLTINNDFTRQPFVKVAVKKKKPLSNILVGKFYIKSANLHNKLKTSVIDLDDAQMSLESLIIDSIQTSTKPVITFNNTLLAAAKVTYTGSKDNLNIMGVNLSYKEIDSTFIINNLAYSTDKKDVNFSLNTLKISGLDKQKLEFRNELNIRKLELIEPKITINASSTQKGSLNNPLDLQKIILSKGLKTVNLDTILIINGSSSVSLKESKTLDLHSFKGIVTNINIDTNTTVYGAINEFKGVFEFKDIYLRGLTDTIAITKMHLNTDQSFIWTDSIHVDVLLKKNNLKIHSPGIAIDHIDIPKLLENKIDISRISTRNNLVILTQTDTVKYDTAAPKEPIKLPINLIIGNINIINTTFDYNKILQPNHLLADLNFDIELDSLLIPKGQAVDIAMQTSDSRFRSYNFSFNLPDSLNTIGFDTMLISSGKSKMNLSNFTLTARYPKYEYGNHVGHQVDWKDLLIEKIKIENIDFVELIEKQSFLCTKIIIDNGHLKLFKDKQLPFPSDRVVPILQERVMHLSLPINIDTVEIKSFDIYQSTLQSTGLQEGGITFMDTKGLITNVTNDSSRLKSNKMLNVVASTQIMGSGNLYADMNFDMLDPNNLFFFDARLGPMDAKAFNNILEATAQVSVKNGAIKSLNLHATGNKKYAYGDMSFIYNNLKVETLNKKTLENKGMGKVIKTFFANAFVVKKNNSRIKFISRRGGMYYERDISRVILDYMAKTAISGVVSSIGAKSNNKQIKQIAKDNKAARDLELKQQKELDKAAKKAAKKK